MPASTSTVVAVSLKPRERRSFIASVTRNSGPEKSPAYSTMLGAPYGSGRGSGRPGGGAKPAGRNEARLSFSAGGSRL